MNVTARGPGPPRPRRYRGRVPKSRDTSASLTAWRRRVVSRAVQGGWRWIQEAGAVSAEHPGRLRFARIGTGTRLAFPQGTVFGEPWIELGDHCVIGEHVTLTAGMMPGLDLGGEPVLRLGDGVVLGRGSHVIADSAVTIGSNTYCGPYVYITSTNHSYDDPEVPVGKQWPRSERVSVGPGCWLGTGAVILPGRGSAATWWSRRARSYGARCPTTRWSPGRPRGSYGAGTRSGAGSRRCVRPRPYRSRRVSPRRNCWRWPSWIRTCRDAPGGVRRAGRGGAVVVRAVVSPRPAGPCRPARARRPPPARRAVSPSVRHARPSP